jgi:pyruvate kinase
MKTSPNAMSNFAPPAEILRARRAKIVATLGPSCSTVEVFRQLVRAGLDVARLNFSHGTHAQKADLIRMVRAVAREEKKPICILADLQGPKIRTGKLRTTSPSNLSPANASPSLPARSKAPPRS